MGIGRSLAVGLGAALFLLAGTAAGDARSDAKRYFKSGMAHIAEGRFEEGIADLEKADEILPHPSVQYNIKRARAQAAFAAGMEHINEGRHQEGVVALERAYAIFPHPAVQYNIGRAYAELGQPAKALAAFEVYLASEPADQDRVKGEVAALRAEIARLKVEPEPTVAPQPDAPEPAAPAPAPVGQPAPRPGVVRPGGVDFSEPLPGDAASEGVYEERVVTSSRREQSPLDSPNSTTVVTRQDIRLSGITRIPELLRRVAGVDVMQITGGDANVSIRGLNSRLSNKVLVLINGRAIKNDILGNTFWEQQSIDVDQVERIEVVRGPGSALYGADAVAGVINLITLEPGEGGTGFRAGYGDHNEIYTSGWASGRSEDFDWRASTGFTQRPRWTREIQRGRRDVVTADVDQNVGAQNARFDLRFARKLDEEGAHRLYAGGGYAHSLIDMYGIGPFNDYALKTNTADATAGYKGDLVSVRSYYSLLDARASQNAAYIGHTLYPAVALQHSFDTLLQVSPQFDTGPLTHRLVTGAGYRLKNIEWNYLVDEPPVEHHLNVFVQDAVSMLDGHLTVVVSGRLDYVPFLERVVPSGRGTVIVKPSKSKQQAIRAGVANAFRAPTFLESYLDLPIQLPFAGLEVRSSSERLDDPDFKLGPENMLETEVAYLNQESELFQVEVAGYYRRITDLIQLAEPRTLTLSNRAAGVGGINPVTGQLLVGNGGWENTCAVHNVVGGELGGRFYGVEGLDLFANYAINFGLLELDDGCAQPDDRKTSQHKVNVGGQVRTAFGLDTEITFHWQSAQIWGEQIATLDGIQVDRFDLPAYHLLNGRIGYRFLDDRANVAVTVYNALAGAIEPAAQQHPFGNRVGRRFMGFFSYRL